MYTADNICNMIEFLIDNIFVQFGGRLFHQVIGIQMGTNCAPLLADLFLYSHENEFPDNMINSSHRKLARSFNPCYRYLDDLIVFNNKKFLDYLKEIYPSQLIVEKANKSDHLADYLDLTFIMDSGGKLSTRLHDKCDDFDFPHCKFSIPLNSTLSIFHSFPATYQLAVTGVMHEADGAYSIRSTWSCYWLDQFLTLALNTLTLLIFYISLDLSTIYFAHFSGC